LRIDGGNLVVAVVAQQLVDVLQGVGNELAFRPEDAAQVSPVCVLYRRRMRSPGAVAAEFVTVETDLAFTTAGAPSTDASTAELLRKERRWFMSCPRCWLSLNDTPHAWFMQADQTFKRCKPRTTDWIAY
jgi:hypothetical protein